MPKKALRSCLRISSGSMLLTVAVRLPCARGSPDGGGRRGIETPSGSLPFPPHSLSRKSCRVRPEQPRRRLLAGLAHYARSRTLAVPSESSRRRNGNPVVASCVRPKPHGRDNTFRLTFRSSPALPQRHGVEQYGSLSGSSECMPVLKTSLDECHLDAIIPMAEGYGS